MSDTRPRLVSVRPDLLTHEQVEAELDAALADPDPIPYATPSPEAAAYRKARATELRWLLCCVAALAVGAAYLLWAHHVEAWPFRRPPLLFPGPLWAQGGAVWPPVGVGTAVERKPDLCP